MPMRFLIIVLALSLHAEEAKAPEITTEEQRDWQRVRADMADTQAAAAAAVKAYQDKTAELAKKCGDRQLVKNAQGDPVCAEKK